MRHVLQNPLAWRVDLLDMRCLFVWAQEINRAPDDSSAYIYTTAWSVDMRSDRTAGARRSRDAARSVTRDDVAWRDMTLRRHDVKETRSSASRRAEVGEREFLAGADTNSEETRGIYTSADCVVWLPCSECSLCCFIGAVSLCFDTNFFSARQHRQVISLKC